MGSQLETIATVWMIVHTAITLFIAIYTWVGNRDKVSRQAIEGVDEDLRKMGMRIDKDLRSVGVRVGVLEETVRHMPGKSELDTLHKRITEAREVQQAMQGELHGMNRTLNLIHEYLLHNRGN